MRSLKLLVTSVFVLFAAAFFLGRQFQVSVLGKTLGSDLAAPTGFSATDRAYANKVGLRWDTIRGATVYRVFRNTTNNVGTAVEVGSTAANYFFDPTAVPEQVYFYWVRSENGADISQFSSPDQGTRAAAGVRPPGPLPPLEPPIAPAGNPVTAAKAYLGKALFWDEQLSSTKTVSCGTCHRPAHGGSDPRTAVNNNQSRNPGPDGDFGTVDDIFGSPGVPQNYSDGSYGWNATFGMDRQVTGRKSPTYLNAGYFDNGVFWDGRAADIFRDPLDPQQTVLDTRASLESQVIFPPISSAEMGHQDRDWIQVAARVAASKPLALATDVPTSLSTWIGGRSYPELFQEAFGSPDVTPIRIAMAIATHERTLFTDQTPFDRSEAGIEPLTDAEQRGRGIFVNNCATCHSGPLTSDRGYHNIGVRPSAEDIGRAIVTGGLNDTGAFKTSTLRNLELRGPFFHNGRFATVEDVVAFYNRGGDFPNEPSHDSRVHPLGLPAGAQADLAAFLKRPLTDDRVRNELPPFDRPHLYTESNHVPIISGTGRSGSGAFVPDAIAIEPPLLGNQSFTVAVRNALGGAQATLVIDSADPGVGSAIPATGSFTRRIVSLQGGGSGSGYGSAVLQIPNNPALVGQTFYGRWYVADPNATNGFSVSQLITFTVFGDAVAIHHTPFDFDGDGKTDVGVTRPNGALEWWLARSSDSNVFATSFGLNSDVAAPADLTGDGKTDVAVFRPSSGQWFVLRSEDNTYLAFPFGTNGDIAMPADYDGDGKADPAVFRPSTATWYIARSSDNQTTIAQFGAAGDQPIAADYDGDFKADIGVYRLNNGVEEWWVQRSTAGLFATVFGAAGDKAVPGDYTGDGKADIAVWRPSNGNWFILRSEDASYLAFPWGATGDIPAPGDYDGDGKFDAAVFRQSSATWFVNRTGGSGPLITNFGASTDSPVAGSFVR
jgi:cytochrome c peroxidase